MAHKAWYSERGFTLIDVLVVASIIGVLSAIAVPTITATLDNMRLGQFSREVERELQTAKSRAVGKGRVIRIRFNCPVVGQYRITELIGTASVPAAADAAANRCDIATYPYPAADVDQLTLPNLDGPVRFLGEEVTFSQSQTVEFWPDGTAHYAGGGAVNPWPMIPTAGIQIQLTRKGNTSSISVNGLGKILLAQ
jgi:prepilin-type N-terminal cleavage/methylation domain-containing protein